jgi:AcrR family transcriptional regulator
MTVKPLPSKKVTQAESTRRAVLAAARAAFGERGYASTSVDEIVRRAGLTKGALYHHFRDKDDLFLAVVEAVKRDVTNTVGAAFVEAASRSDPIQTIVVGCQAFIDAHADPAVQRITILDARAVLDAATRRDLDARYEVAVVRGALRRAMNVGAIDRQPLAPLAHVVAGALAEACALVAEGADRDEVGAVVAHLLYGLQTPTS